MPSVATSIALSQSAKKNPNFLITFFIIVFVLCYAYIVYLIGSNIKSGLIDNLSEQNKFKLLGEFSVLLVALSITIVKVVFRLKRGSDTKSDKYKDADKKYTKLWFANIGMFIILCAVCFFDKSIGLPLKDLLRIAK
jgi:hypothetical protein